MKKQVKELIQKQTNTRSMDTEVDYDDYYRKLMGLVRLEGDDPVWRKFASLATPSFESLNEAQLRMQAQQLWKSKLELLAHLEKVQIELKMAQESTELRVGLYLKDKEALEEELRQAKARLD
ncbi:hypothetical protein DAPPUDRAFT_344259 [Daphnia pulex]|uniref:Uncharacterized protein n=1 Tax=Daphnia pulex TaxID=6669 RepID=E9I6V0_DAPPU|nr:hypothetical protein DAPPUDRAFT_344259 [Daphnia pulex]|eukprot:EFX60280.1 hypothetical protein DAPPUDRAFT_344259 [Daphnia pulex]